MLKSSCHKIEESFYGGSLPNGDTCQQSRADIQNFLLKGWERSRGGLMGMKIRRVRSRSFWSSLIKRRSNFDVPCWYEQRGDGLDSSLHRTSVIMILTQETLERYRANQGYVYLIHAVGTDRYKIGRSINPPVRLETLKKQSPYPLQIVECFWSPDAIADEGYIHANKHLSKRRAYGEWFCFGRSDEDDLDAIDFIYAFAACRPTCIKHLESVKQKIVEVIEPCRHAERDEIKIAFDDLDIVYISIKDLFQLERVVDFTISCLPVILATSKSLKDVRQRVSAASSTLAHCLFKQTISQLLSDIYQKGHN